MNSSTSQVKSAEHKKFTRRQSLILVLLCTLIGAAAQVLLKIGGTRIHGMDVSIITNYPLIAGYALYGINMLMLMIALRDGELSKLYPIIALTFVWVNILSILFFHERINPWKVFGIIAIMAGVSVLGGAGSRRENAA